MKQMHHGVTATNLFIVSLGQANLPHLRNHPVTLKRFPMACFDALAVSER
jgi:hypothetical protein